MRTLSMSSGGIGFIFVMTCLGAATVFFIRKSSAKWFHQIFYGFAAGVMIAASVWSLIIPAIEAAKSAGMAGWLPASCGFSLGVAFMLGIDRIIARFLPFAKTSAGLTSWSRHSSLLIFAVTLHNIPEGMAVGLSFAMAAQNSDNPALYASAVALALGIGIQNFPEGAAVALPIRQEGLSASRAFALACLSGAVEPLFGFATVFLAAWIAPAMPWLLCFAAGAMLYVVVEELIPQAHLGARSHSGTLGVMTGFLIMMALDVAL